MELKVCFNNLIQLDNMLALHLTNWSYNELAQFKYYSSFHVKNKHSAHVEFFKHYNFHSYIEQIWQTIFMDFKVFLAFLIFCLKGVFGELTIIQF